MADGQRVTKTLTAAGAWIIHCHIAFHASSGLAMQVVENAHLIPALQKDREADMKHTCDKWNEWFAEPLNHWNFEEPHEFQDDSGV